MCQLNHKWVVKDLNSLGIKLDLSYLIKNTSLSFGGGYRAFGNEALESTLSTSTKPKTETSMATLH